MSLPRADRFGLVAVTAAAALGLGISLTRPFHAPTALPVRHFDSPQQQQLATLLDQSFGAADAMELPKAFADLISGDARAGRTLYEVQCLHCHGADGHGDTYTARLLHPAPRDFSLGVIKFTSTPSDLPPRQADLERTLQDGLDSTSMSSFANLSDQERQDLAAYVMQLLIRGAVFTEASGQLEQLAPAAALAQAITAEADRWQRAAASPLEPPARPQLQDPAVGAALFRDPAVGCVVCHGENPLPLPDIWGQNTRARDLHDGPLLGGSRAVDLYWRISSGIKGTPMPAMETHLSPDQIWSLVHYVQSLRTP